MGKVIATGAFLTFGLIWCIWIALLNVWTGSFGWGALYFVMACITGWFVLDCLDEIQEWTDYEPEDTCYCIHPIYPAAGHRPHINPRAYDA